MTDINTQEKKERAVLVGLDAFSLSREENATQESMDELAALLEKEMKKQEEAMVPAVIPIPGVKGNTGLGIRRLSQSVEKAVGADIIFQ